MSYLGYHDGDNSDTDDNNTSLQRIFSKLTTSEKVKKRKSQKPLLNPDALKKLSEITTSPITDLQQWLYKADFLDPSHEDHEKIVKYVINSQEHGFGIEVVHIIRMVRNNCREFDHDRSKKRFRMMLWHGTKQSLVSSIIQTGFVKPLKKNQMFGTGVYFADRASKSAGYCDGTSSGKLGYMFLCDVDLGKMFKAKNAHNEYEQPPAGFNTVKCCGKSIPNWKQNEKIKGSILPCGVTKPNERFQNYTLVFNEYVVYEPERVKVKYLVVVKFNSRKVT